MKDKLQNTTKDIKTTLNGTIRLVKLLAELIYGASGLAVVGMATLYTHNSNRPRAVLAVMYTAVTLMGLTACGVLGRYLKRKGGELEQ